MELHAATSNQLITTDAADGWNKFLGHRQIRSNGPTQHVTVCSKAPSLYTLKQKCFIFVCLFVCLNWNIFCRKTFQRQAVEQQNVCLFCLQGGMLYIFILFLCWTFSTPLTSDSIAFLQLLNLIVKLDVLQISQPALSSLSAWAASQINRRKWIIRRDY